MTLYRRQGSRLYPRKRSANTKWLFEKASHIAEKRREVKIKGEKERYTHSNAEFQTIARRDKKTSLGDQKTAFLGKEIEEKIEWERLEITSRKLEIPRKYFMQRGAR